MNEFGTLSNSEMLHLMLDGELDSTMETSLYSALLESEELRQELREILAIRESVHNDVEAYSPPFEATKSIFSKLGYAIPIIPTAIATANKTGVWNKFVRAVWNPLTTAVLASLITAFLFLNFSSEDNVVGNQQISEAQMMTMNMPVIVSEEISSDDLVATNSRKSNLISKNKSAVVTNKVNFPVSDEDTPKMPVANDVSYENVSTNSIAENLLFLPLDRVQYKPLQNNGNQRIFSLNNNIYKPLNTGPSLILHLKTGSAASFPYVNLNETQGNILDNFAVSAFTPLSDNWQLGLEAGKEAFGMSFWDIDDLDNNLYKIEQNPTLIWAGLGIKYVLDKHIEFLANAQPYGHLTLASTAVGPLGKASMGLQFVSENGLGILIGLEGGALIYQNDNNWYTSKKLGVTYGMFMKF